MTESYLLSDARPEPQVTGGKLLADMEKSGLIERNPDARNGRAKPYFITDAGSRYLDDARQSALFSEIGHRQDWSASETATDMQQTVAGFIRQG